MADHACFVFFQDRGIDLEAAAKALQGRGLPVSPNGNVLEVGFPGKPRLRVALVKEAYVGQEASALAQESPFSASMSKCDARLEILIDDLDVVLDEINTLIDVQGALQDLTHGFLFCTWNEEVAGPDWPTA